MLNNLNKKKLIFFSIFSFLLVVLLVSYYLFSSPYCKTYKIFNSLKDFGIKQVNDCFSRYAAKQSIKVILRDYPLLYNLASGFKNKNIRDFELNKPPNEEDFINISTKEKKPKNVKGLVNKEFNENTKYKPFKKLNNL